MPVVRDRLVPLSQLLVDFRPSLDNTGIFGQQRDGPIGIGQTLGVLPCQVVIPGAVVVGRGQIRLELDRLGVIADGLIVEPLAFIRDTAADVGIGIIGLELDRLGEIGDGLIVEPLAAIRGAAAVVGRTRNPAGARSPW